jgi:hypothetical protein
LKNFLDEILNYRSAAPLSVPVPMSGTGTGTKNLNFTGTQRKILAGPEPGPKKNTGTGTGTGTKKSWSHTYLVWVGARGRKLNQPTPSFTSGLLKMNMNKTKTNKVYLVFISKFIQKKQNDFTIV